MSNQKKCLKNDGGVVLVGITPPPYHGQAAATQLLFNAPVPVLEDAFKVRMAFSDTIDRVGKMGFGKVIHLFGVIGKTWQARRKIKGQAVLYYTPGSAATSSLLRDIIFLTMTRPFFHQTVIHFHSGGIPQALVESWWGWRMVVMMAFQNPRCVIELYPDPHGPGNYFQAAKTEVVVNGVAGPPHGLTSHKDDVFRLLFVGSMRESKGILVCLNALYLARKTVPQLRLDMIGVWSGAEEKSKFDQLLKKLQLEDIVTVHGLQTGKDKWQIFAQSDAMIFPTYYESENLPLVIIEAMAAGLPLISTRWRGIPTLVTEKNGILVKPRSPDDTSAAILKLARSPKLVFSMGAAGRKRYENLYTVEQYQKRVASILESVKISNLNG